MKRTFLRITTYTLFFASVASAGFSPAHAADASTPHNAAKVISKPVVEPEVDDKAKPAPTPRPKPKPGPRDDGDGD